MGSTGTMGNGIVVTRPAPRDPATVRYRMSRTREI